MPLYSFNDGQHLVNHSFRMIVSRAIAFKNDDFSLVFSGRAWESEILDLRFQMRPSRPWGGAG